MDLCAGASVSVLTFTFVLVLTSRTQPRGQGPHCRRRRRSSSSRRHTRASTSHTKKHRCRCTSLASRIERLAWWMCPECADAPSCEVRVSVLSFPPRSSRPLLSCARAPLTGSDSVFVRDALLPSALLRRAFTACLSPAIMWGTSPQLFDLIFCLFFPHLRLRRGPFFALLLTSLLRVAGVGCCAHYPRQGVHCAPGARQLHHLFFLLLVVHAVLAQVSPCLEAGLTVLSARDALHRCSFSSHSFSTFVSFPSFFLTSSTHHLSLADLPQSQPFPAQKRFNCLGAASVLAPARRPARNTSAVSAPEAPRSASTSIMPIYPARPPHTRT